MKVYDCCCFLNENDLYEIRLNEHWDFVDKFIVVEAGETHTGRKKNLNFDHKRFEPYASKIEYRSFESFDEEILKYPHLIDSYTTNSYGKSENSKDWMRDHFQHNYITKVLNEIGAEDTDIVYISCLDEILNKSALEYALPHFQDKDRLFANNLRPIFLLNMYLYAYKINLLHKHWHDHYVGTITEISNFKKMLPATIRQTGTNTHGRIPNAGWHFTFLDNTDGEMVLEKQRSWAHSRDPMPEGEKLKYDNTTKEEALNKFFRDYKVSKVDILEDTHPRYLVDNLDKYQNLIYKGTL